MTFKIQRDRQETAVVLKLSGRIQKENVDELRRLFEVEQGDGDLVLDLEEVKLVDRDVVGFLETCEGRACASGTARRTSATGSPIDRKGRASRGNHV